MKTLQLMLEDVVMVVTARMDMFDVYMKHVEFILSTFLARSKQISLCASITDSELELLSVVGKKKDFGAHEMTVHQHDKIATAQIQSHQSLIDFVQAQLGSC